MIWRAYALLTHAAGRIGLRRFPQRKPVAAIRSGKRARAALQRLDEAVWVAGALGAAAESGLLDHLDQSHDLTGFADSAGMPPQLAEAILDVLIGAGLASRTGDRYVVAAGVRDLAARNGSEWLRGATRATWLQVADLRQRARTGALDLSGWRHTDPEIIEAQGAVTFGMVQDAIPRLAFLPGLVASLEQPGAALLDIGAGAAGLSIALCRHFPQLRSIGLEPAGIPAEIGRMKIKQAGLEHRIEIRGERAEHLTMSEAFDVTFLPQMFLAGPVLDTALERILRALKPGGWLLTASLSRPGGDLPSAVGRLQSVLWGGGTRHDAAVQRMLERTGFDPVILPPGGGSMRVICAQRPA